MSGFVGVVTRKGQITIPVALRRELGIDVGDTVEMRMDGQGIHVEKRDVSIAERTKGMFRHAVPNPLYTREQERASFEVAMAEGASDHVVR